MSQSALAQHLGITFQQVQKYERGANRVSASTLYEIAKALSTTVTALFEGLPETAARQSENKLARFIQTKESATVIELFPDLGEDGCRGAIAALIREIAAARRRRFR